MTDICKNCGKVITQEYAGTFWKAPDPMPMMWVHAHTRWAWCSVAEPVELYD